MREKRATGRLRVQSSANLTKLTSRTLVHYSWHTFRLEANETSGKNIKREYAFSVEPILSINPSNNQQLWLIYASFSQSLIIETLK